MRSFLVRLTSRLVFWHQSNPFEEYISKKAPKSVAEVEYLISDYLRNQAISY